MYFFFVKSLEKALKSYTEHPVFQYSSSEYFDIFRKIFRRNFKQYKLNDKDSPLNTLTKSNNET